MNNAGQSLNCFFQIDVLVNNAGRSQRAMFIDTDLEVDRQMFDLNVLSILSLTKLVLPHMLERKHGHIVAMSSIAGKMGKFCFIILILNIIIRSEHLRVFDQPQ